jgi:hypothetical protein
VNPTPTNESLLLPTPLSSEQSVRFLKEQRWSRQNQQSFTLVFLITPKATILPLTRKALLLQHARILLPPHRRANSPLSLTVEQCCPYSINDNSRQYNLTGSSFSSSSRWNRSAARQKEFYALPLSRIPKAPPTSQIHFNLPLKADRDKSANSDNLDLDISTPTSSHEDDFQSPRNKVACFYYTYRPHGFPQSIISDRDPEVHR